MDGNREIDRIAFDCPRKCLPWERPPSQYDSKGKARFTDLEATSRLPLDLPPMMRKLHVKRREGLSRTATMSDGRELHVVTGAFGYSGRDITEQLLQAAEEKRR